MISGAREIEDNTIANSPKDRDRQSRYFDDFRSQGDSGPSIYSRSQERNDGYDGFQSRRSRTSDYDDRPEPFRP